MAVTDFVNLARGAQDVGNAGLESQIRAFNLAKEQVPLERQAQFRELTKGLDLNNPDLAPFVKGGFAQEILPSVPDLWQAKLLGQKIAAANQGTPWTQQQKVEQTLDSVQHQPGPVLPPGVPADQNQQPPAQNVPTPTPPGIPQQAPKDPVAEYMDFKHNPQFARYASLDPMFKTQYDTQSGLLHDAAITQIGQEYKGLREAAKTPNDVANVDAEISAKYAPLASDPAFKEIIEAGKRTNPIFNMPYGGVGAAMPPPNVIADAAKRIAGGQSTVSEEINKGRFTGATAMQVHNELVNQTRALKPDFEEANSESGYSFAKNPSTKRAVSQLDNAYSTIDRLRKVYSGLDNTQYPTLNKAINAGKIQVGDVATAKAAMDEVLGNDELTQAFARGGIGSDKLRDMSAALANKNLSPQQMAAQFDEILNGVDRSRAAYETQGAGYIKPPKYRTETNKEGAGGVANADDLRKKYNY